MATHIEGFTVTDEIIDLVARSAYTASASKTGTRFTPWQDASPRFRETFREHAVAALDALEASQWIPIDML